MAGDRVTINITEDFWEFLQANKRRGQSIQDVIEELIHISEDEDEIDPE
jgi:predicted CopG family antitoxin